MQDSVVAIKSTKYFGETERIIGLEKQKMPRWAGTKFSFQPFEKHNGTFDHGITEKQDIEFIEKGFLSGEKLDSDLGKERLAEFIVVLNNDITYFDLSIPQERLAYLICLNNPTFVAKDKTTALEEPMRRTPYYISETQQDEREKYSTGTKLSLAFAELEKMKDNKEFLVAIAEYLSPSYKNFSTKEYAFNFLAEVLQGEHDNGSSIKGVNRFLRCLDNEDTKKRIYMSALAKKALFHNIIIKEGSVFINIKTGNALGNSIDGVVDFLLRPENSTELGSGSKTDTPTSIKSQLNRIV